MPRKGGRRGRSSVVSQLVRLFRDPERGLYRLGNSKRDARQRIVALKDGPRRRAITFEPMDGIYGAATLRRYMAIGVKFVVWARDRYKISDLAHVRMATMGTTFVQEQYIDRGKAPATIKVVLPALDMLAQGIERYKQSKRIGRIDRDRLVIPKRRRARRSEEGDDVPQARQERRYTQEEATRILGYLRGKGRSQEALILELQWQCGLRISEAVGLRVRMVDRANKALIITDTNITKGGRDRKPVLPVPDHLYDRLAPALAEAEAARGPEGRILLVRREWVWYWIARACSELGIRNRSAHGFRHTYANQRVIEQVARGVERWDAFKQVSEELGHGRPSATYTYVRF